MEDTELDIEDDVRSSARGNSLERFRAVSAALSDAARRTRISTRRTGSFSAGGFKARRGAKAARLLVAASFVVFVALPSLVAAGYLFFIASDQYVSEADFTVTAGEAPLPDGMASLTGLPMLAIVQDTQIITNFVHSRAAVDILEQRVGLRKLYASTVADWWARFDPDKPVERFVKYWEQMTTATIGMPAGIVQLKVRAFSPQDAQRIAQATVEVCEQLVNDLNARMNKDAVDQAEQELQHASKRLATSLAALEQARDASGILETSKSAEALNALIRDSKTSLLNLTGQYESRLKYVSAEAPQMQDLRLRIDVTRNQIAEIEGKLTTSPTPVGATGAGESTIAGAMTKFGKLELERKVSEQLYSSASAALEHARLNAENKQMYLKAFVLPQLPQEAQFPKRWLDMFIIVSSSLGFWGLLCGIAALARNHMA